MFVYLPHEVPVEIDLEDYDLIRQYTWWGQYSKETCNIYAYTLIRNPPGSEIKRKKIYMHRLITKCPVGLIVDHKDRNTLNNKRNNLRITTGTYNNVNREIKNSTGYRGVSKVGDKYTARISKGYYREFIGTFDTKEEAALHYNQKAIEYFGEFAFLNEIIT